MPSREFVEGITFAEFTELARRNRWTAADLAREFRGFGGKPDVPGHETPRHYFERVFTGKPSPDSLIVYRPVIEKYVNARRASALGPNARGCCCGCGGFVFGRKHYYGPSCRKRMERERRRRPVGNETESQREAGTLPGPEVGLC